MNYTPSQGLYLARILKELKGYPEDSEKDLFFVALAYKVKVSVMDNFSLP